MVELAAYRSLAEQAGIQLRRGHVVIMEADADYLPDTSTTYHLAHRKTTVAVVGVDPAGRTARYLHNVSCFEVSGDDFDGLFDAARTPRPPPTCRPTWSWPSCRLRHRPTTEVRTLARHLAAGVPDERRRWLTYRQVFADDIAGIVATATTAFDDYAFVTLRQLGAGCALAARFIRWLGGEPDERAAAYGTISRCAKRLILKAARTAATGWPLDAGASFAELISAAWEIAGAAEGRVIDGPTSDRH